MQHGFVKVGVCKPGLKVADCEYNGNAIIEEGKRYKELGAKILVFPELSITSYTCGDLFLQEPLLNGALEALHKIKEETAEWDTMLVVGLPFMFQSRLFNVAAVMMNGKLLGLIPKTYVPSYQEFYEGRHFQGWQGDSVEVKVGEDVVKLGTRQIFCCAQVPALRVAVEICEDLWAPIPPSSYHAQEGATVILNLSASDEMIGKAAYRRELVRGQSARTLTAYLYGGAGYGESSTDLVFGGHGIICENGRIINEREPFSEGLCISEVDVNKLESERRRIGTFPTQHEGNYEKQSFAFDKIDETSLSRRFSATPFVPSDSNTRDKRCEEILNIQSQGLAKRLQHIGCKNAVIGLSGGLDSTLALLVTVRAYERLRLDKKGITAITMPCFGTTKRTHDNAQNMAQALGVSFKEVPIKDAVLGHFRDIGHDANVQDVTYENSQARERTQVLMDYANEVGGIVIGTGDLSELALGWATYNGDHMSMYGVNASIPKTLIRYLVSYYADHAESEILKKVLYDVLDTPVSPELLPPKEGEISQKTEELVGPYELHDFFLYYMMRFGFMPEKILRMAATAFEGKYDPDEIDSWLKTFYQRFFSQAFKRSCLPDGPKVGSVALSPRGDFRMPSDAVVNGFLRRNHEEDHS